MLPEAPGELFTATDSIYDRPAFTLLIEALARLTSTSMTNSSLLSGTGSDQHVVRSFLMYAERVQQITWENPEGINTAKGIGFLYLIKVMDPTTGVEHRYIGKSTTGESRLRAYRRNVQRIFRGATKRPTVGQTSYRAVHLALAKAVEHGWIYEILPLENVPIQKLNEIESLRIEELGCNLNYGPAWKVEDYPSLTLSGLLRASIEPKESGL